MIPLPLSDHRKEIHRVTVNGRACERISFANGDVLYFAQSADVRFPTFRLVPKAQHKFRAAIDKAIGVPIEKFKHCSVCGLGEGEWRACEEPDCGELK